MLRGALLRATVSFDEAFDRISFGVVSYDHMFDLRSHFGSSYFPAVQAALG